MSRSLSLRMRSLSARIQHAPAEALMRSDAHVIGRPTLYAKL